MKKNVIIFFLMTHLFGIGQNEANYWYFGQNSGLDFNSGTAIALGDGQMTTLEGCATISDSNGNLLFYTNGVLVWDKNHNVMTGPPLLGDNSSTQSAIIVPSPTDQNLYYIFAVDSFGGPKGLTYSIVDMNLNSGLGGLTSTQNVLLQNNVSERITAVKHANGNDIWVITHKYLEDKFIAYLINNSGINLMPIVSVSGVVNGINDNNSIGYLKVSPDGSKIAFANSFNKTAEVFSFNNSTGIISNPILISNFDDGTFQDQIYGIEFSPSSRYLYVSEPLEGIYQFDLNNFNSTDVINSRVFISQGVYPPAEGHHALQLGPDGKIYVAHQNAFVLGRIENPNEPGLAANYIYDAVPLIWASNLGLPPFIQSFFNVGFQYSNLCLGETTQFTANIAHSYDTVSWNFGDGNTSNLENPTHVYTAPGTYDVTINITSGGQTASDTKPLTIYEQPTATQPQNITVCDTDNDGLASFDLTTQDSAILNGQSTTTFEVVYYASLTDYTNNNPITTPTNYTNTTTYSLQTIVASVRNQNNTVCEEDTTFDIQVFESPTPNMNVPSLTSCDNTSFGTDTDGVILFDLTQNANTILNGQSATSFSVSYFTDAALTNPIATPSAFQNTATTQTIYVQVVNNANNTCVATTSFEVEVFDLPVVNAIVELRQCDDDLDGFSIFNLIEASDEITTNAINETLTFYETLADAQNGNNPILNPTTYSNHTVSVDTVWVSIVNANNCLRTAQLNLVVSTTQIPNTFTRDFYACDDAIDGDTTNGIAAFDFSAVTTDIQAMFPTGQQITITYYENIADALAENNAIVDIANFRNINSPTTQDIYIRVDSDLDNDCLGLGNHITLHVEVVPVANVVTVTDQCDDDGDGLFAFDTTGIESTLLNGQTNVTVTYTDAAGNSLPSPLPNPFVTDTEVVTAVVINSNSQDPNGPCSDSTVINFNVDLAVVANNVPDFVTCDDDSDGLFAFDTFTIESTILGAQTNMIVTYTDANGNVLPSPLPNPFVTATQSVTAHVENVLSTFCFDTVTFNFIVDAQPIANTIADDIVCDDVSNNGLHTFTLSNYDTQILNTQSNTVFDVFYFDSNANAIANVSPLANMHVLSAPNQTIYARIQNSTNTSCFAVTSFEIGISYMPIANFVNDISVCDDMSNDGVEVFNLTDQNAQLLGAQNSVDHTITYHNSVANANSGANILNNNYSNQTSPETIYARIESNINTNCYSIISFQLYVQEQPVLLMDEQWSICEEDTITIVADQGYDAYLWSTGEATSSITVANSGTYTVTASNIFGSLTCDATKTISVVESSIATITNIDTIDWTQNDNMISVYVNGLGDYEYSLDGIHYQESNEFTNLSIADYTVFVRDKNGCGIASEDLYLLYYPKMFSPNGDGINDYWQLFNSGKETRNKIIIFDRFGKIVAQTQPDSNGWDGTYNGRPLPATDYWFLVKRQNGKTHRGHFSLMR